MLKKYRISALSAIILAASSVTVQKAEAVEFYNNFGAGVGVPFGIFGVSYELEMNLTDWFAVGPTVAVGTSILGGGTTEVGLQLHFGDKNSLLRYGVSYWSGTNTIVETSFDEFETLDGETIGINLRIQLGSRRSHSIDVHVLKILTPDEEEVQNKLGFGVDAEGGDVKLGVGYVYRF
ncbi:hypothetical protein MNBD_GAMMA11-1683 [hydrothermal vent metagenome]|uniref:Outer membrane protein beta-barrel domain-containing protein n=1 Tax=hydrothermal vent metagenome TaxID=652676 RepID=A0A3B0X2K6_9ZZZZ